MAARANEGPRNPVEWLERLSEIMPDGEKQRELKNKFCPIRETTITELTNIKDRLSAINKRKNRADIGGAGITFISSFLAVTGQICSLSGLVKPDVCELIVDGGRIGSLFGKCVSSTSKGINKTAEWWNAKTVRSILEEDAKSSMALMGSLIQLEELKKIVEEVMSFDMFTRMVNFFKRKPNVDVEEVNADLPPQIYYIIRSSSLSKSSKAKVEEWMTAIYRSLPSRNSFFSVMGMCKNIDLADTKQTYGDLCVLKAKFLDTNSTLSLLKTNYDYRTREGLINAVMLGVDVLSLCNQCQSISKKCRDVDIESEFVTKLEECISILQEELNIIKSLNLD